MRTQFDRIKEAAGRDPSPPWSVRKRRLDSLLTLLHDNGDRFGEAISADFGHRSPQETQLLELFPSLEAVRHALRHGAGWMRDEPRSTSIWFLPGSSKVVYQPLGVVGIIAPWNYPLYLAAGPLVAALAAGNRAMLKLSEFTPRTAELFDGLLRKAFADDEVVVVHGDATAAAEFSRLPFDHLLFTGSTAVGRHVMHAAAENLTPVTLELGGKSPVIVSASADIEDTAGKIVTGKGQNAGQLCIAPDYAFVPESRLEVFLESCRKNFVAQYPTTVLNPDYNAMINERHYDRVLGYIEEARAAGARIIELNPGREDFSDRVRHKIPLHIVVNPDDGLKVMQEEIFGPVLVVKTYRDIGECIAYVNARARPLALYWFGRDEAERERVLRETISGGVSVNNVMMHFACDDLPFGGVGGSGMGHYHGRDGFRTFSHAKGVFREGRLNLSKLAGTLPPFGPKLAKMLDGQIRK